MRHRILVGLTLSSTVLLVAAACGPGLFDGLTGGDAGTDGGPMTGATCNLELPPAAPTNEDSAERPELFFAFEDIKIDTSPAIDGGVAPPRGFDLDGLCTVCLLDAGNVPSPPSCVPPRSATATASSQCDLSNGRDNNLGAMFDTLRQNISQVTADFATQKIRQGLFTVLVDLKGWNGTDDDPNVGVTIYGSQGIDGMDGGHPLPRFDGTDTWSIDPGSLTDGDKKNGLDCRIDQNFCVPQPGRVAQKGNAYVSGGTLVAKFASVPLNIGTNVGGLVFDLDAPALVAKLSKDDSGHDRLTGQFIGRWPIVRALPAIAALSFPDPINPKQSAPLCTNLAFYTVVKAVVCTEPDLPARNGGSTTEPCGSISSSISFAASAEQRPSFAYERPGSGVEPCPGFTDTCPP